ncbi:MULTISPECIES: YfbU family protein [unclassified Shinella]|uniref:YfbU family protein n=1 Tax=unclassified Shinella TaxID=2643062 RepID=UPI00225CF040|nr:MULTISPECIES: YfbU family protein [unclassified Shinella]MCO5139274.1 YfbU family protein [Shinella sp.]MDC7255997.1 YfbU family protein [Shinella sp. YE25]CAI0338834.1 conserved hypothetical protein [Rhizobiaceae bacterium]CAK7257262.1 YfbU family protein [Shinella sp. WSC3-e]
MLTWAERLTLWNQYEILKRINPDDTKEYETNQEILSHGYEQWYPEINPSIYAETLKPEVSGEVIDILSMFRAIKHSCIRLGYTPKSSSAEFAGFDGNDDGGHYGFARFLRRTLGRWEELKDLPDNSHSSFSLNRYRRMHEAWQLRGGSHELTAEQIEEIAEA